MISRENRARTSICSMLGGNKANPMLPFLADDNKYQYQNNSSNQLQLFGSADGSFAFNLGTPLPIFTSWLPPFFPVPATFGVNPVAYPSEENIMSMAWANKRSRATDEVSQQQNHVSTGLRLSYDEEEHNSSITSASGSMAAAPSIIMSFDQHIQAELNNQNEEFDRFLKVQEEYLVKGVRDIKERHTASFLCAVERGISKKLHEKDTEIENMNRRNRELGERIKQVAMEVQTWQYRANYNESVVNALKTNIQQAMSMGADQGKEGFGDSEVDDAASYINLNNNTSSDRGFKDHLVCKVCRLNEVSVLLIPCRHLCLCKNCNGLVTICPVCRLTVTDCLPVYLS